MPRFRSLDNEDLAAMLAGYMIRLASIEQAIEDIRRRMGNSGRRIDGAGRRPTKRHTISAEGRARIAAAQRKRWAAVKRAEK